MADPLKIGVEVDVSQIPKLAEATQNVAVNVNALTEQFLKGSGSGKEFEAGISQIASSAVSAAPQLQNMVGALGDVKTLLDAAKVAAGESAAMIEEAGGRTGVTTSFMRNYAEELARVTVLERAYAAGKTQLKSATVDALTAEQTAAEQQAAASAKSYAAAAQQAAAAETAASATAEQAAANDALVGSQAAATEATEAGAAATAERNLVQRESLSAGDQLVNGLAGIAGANVRAAEATEQGSTALSRNIPLVNQVRGVFQQANAAILQQAQATGANVAPAQQAAAAQVQFAQRLMQTGLTANQVQSVLRNQGVTAQQATAVMNQLTGATNNAGNAAQNLTQKIDPMERMLAKATARVGLTEVGAGRLGFALSNLGAASGVLAPILAAAFPVIGAIALLQILGQLDDKMKEWATQAQTTEDEGAKFERSMDRSAEALDRVRERAAGAISPLAELAQKMADAGHQSVDLTSQVEALNKYLETLPGAGASWSAAIGQGWQSVTDLFRSQSSIATREVDLFERHLADTTKTAKDLPGALASITLEMGTLTRELAQYKADQWISENENVVKSIEKIITALGQQATAVQQQIDATKVTKNTDQSEQEQKGFEAHVRAVQSRIAFDEAQAKILVRVNEGSLEDEQKAMLRLEEENTRLQVAEVSKRITALRALDAQQKGSGQSVDNSGAFKALEADKTRVVQEGATKRFEIIANSSIQIQERDLQLADSEIATNAKIAESRLNLGKAADDAKLRRADSPALVEAAVIPILERESALYRAQAQELRDKAAAQLKSLPESVGKKPTVELGTDEFSAQVKAMRNVQPEIINMLLQLNAQEIALRNSNAEQTAQIEIQKQNRIREIRSQDVSNLLADLNDELTVERGNYDKSVTLAQAGMAEKVGANRHYYETISALAEKNYQDQATTLAKEETVVRAAVDSGVLTRQEGERRLAAIYKREEEAHAQMLEHEAEAAKKEVENEEADIKRVTNKIAEDFVQMANKILTTHTSIGKQALQLGRQLELYIIDQGIKKVVSQYATQLLQMVAAHSTFLAHILGIETASAAAQTAVHETASAAQTAVTITADQAQAHSVSVTDVGEVFSYAGTGAAAAAAAAAPGGPEAMAAAAAAAEAIILGFLPQAAISFGHGGVVNANVHEGEMVLPQHISNFVQKSAAQAVSPSAPASGGTNTAIHNHNYNVRVDGTGRSTEEMREMVHAAVLPAIKNAHRRGQLGTRGY